jgi:hypothetical protein
LRTNVHRGCFSPSACCSPAHHRSTRPDHVRQGRSWPNQLGCVLPLSQRYPFPSCGEPVAQTSDLSPFWPARLRSVLDCFSATGDHARQSIGHQACPDICGVPQALPSLAGNYQARHWFQTRGRGVSIGHDGDGGRSGFSDFSLRATKRQASAQPVRRVLNPRSSQ